MPILDVGQEKKPPTPPLNERGLFETFEKDGKRITEILRFNAVEVFFAGFIPPLVGSVSAIVIALVFHNDAISNYNWQCGRARLPSLSRIINLSVERTFWQLFLLFHVPIRVIELITGFSRYKRLRNVHYTHTWLYELARLVYFYVGLGELVFLSALSIVGERENILEFHDQNKNAEMESMQQKLLVNPVSQLQIHRRSIFVGLRRDDLSNTIKKTSL
ncbi:hypothetical protein GCK32_010335 [Trichostrongylus colubriformis]|uniref:CWH43-like N-terminal domain-containing protein n=1 Tax=Trichostrongylus colubriformis TaxID=6319 RepID=A0AAN8F7E9_TRICO